MNLVVAVAALLLVTVSSSAAYTSEQSASGRAITGRMIVTPRDDALTEGARARVSFRPPAGTSRLWVRLNNRLVSARFARAGSLRVANLTTRDGLRRGTNTIYVLAARHGRQPLADSRSFVFGRRVRGLARLRMNVGAVTSVDLQVAAPKLTPAVFASGSKFNQDLAVIRRDRRVRIWLNSKPVTGAFDRPQPTHWMTSLSATQGLRHGVNRLRALVLEPETGRYDVLRRQFVVPDVPLPAAGPDLSRPLGAGDQMPLDGRRSVNDGHGPLKYRWQILSKPAGSNPKLLHPSSATPIFDPDRSGRYRLGLRVSDSTGSRGARASSSRMDVADEVVGPSQLLVPFTGFVPPRENGHGTTPSGIQVNGHFYPAPGPGSFQWLTLDRETLKPIPQLTGSIDPSSSDPAHSLDAIENALKNGGHGELMILAHASRTLAPLKPDQVDQFNRILKTLGVNKIDADSLSGPGSDHQQLVIVGVPYGGDGSGYYSQIQALNFGKAVLKGFLMPDSVAITPGTPTYRFQPEKVKFDTFNGQNFGGTLENEMELGSETVKAPGPSYHMSARGGFQVVAIDPETFQPIDPKHDNRTFVTSPLGDGAPANAIDQRAAMATYLRSLVERKVLVAVQSIGEVSVTPPADADRGASDAAVSTWRDIDRAMQALGANPNTFYTTDRAYAFIGGPMLDRSEDVDSSTGIVIDKSVERHMTESGTLQGFASVRPDGLMKPAVSDGSDALQFKMYDVAFQAPTPWPHTAPDDPEAGAYSRALAYVSTCLPEFHGWGPDLRSAYGLNLSLNYSAAQTHLDKLPYPGDPNAPHDCTQWDYAKAPGFTADQYRQLSDELDQEFVWLDSIGRLFASAQGAIARSSTDQGANLKNLGNKLKDQIAPPSTTAKVFEDIGEFFLLVFEDVALIPASVGPLAFVEAVAALYQISTSLASDTDTGEPLGTQIDKKVDDLSAEAADRLVATAGGLDRLQQVIISDYGRLKALGSVASTPAYTPDVSTVAATMSRAANQWFSSALLPLLYGVHALHLRDIVKGEATTKNCYITLPAGYLFSKEPDSTQMKWYGAFDRDRYRGEFPTLFALGLHNLHNGPPYVPPEDLANEVFNTVGQGGFGLQLQRFIWDQYQNSDQTQEQSPPPTDIAICN
jgi:hypothetical protein